MKAVLLSGAVGLALTLFGTRAAIGWLIAHEFGQPIRVDGPSSHQVKRGIPTMGGGVILSAATASYLLATSTLGPSPSGSGLLVLLVMWGCGAVGYIDDYIKVHQQNNKGLSGRWKIAGQTGTTVAFCLLGSNTVLDWQGQSPVSMHLSVARDILRPLPFVAVLLIVWLLIAGTSNATNLTDGADGLLTGISAMVFGGYSLLTLWQNNHLCEAQPSLLSANCYEARDPWDLAILCAGLSGACIGFLWWNARPAQIIMGDVGALALGGGLAALAVVTRTELLLVALGGVFVLETLSVILQVSYFKLTRRFTGEGRRILRMAPLHHHFENAGWLEGLVVVRFWILAAGFVLAGLCLFYLDWLWRA